MVIQAKYLKRMLNKIDDEVYVICTFVKQNDSFTFDKEDDYRVISSYPIDDNEGKYWYASFRLDDKNLPRAKLFEDVAEAPNTTKYAVLNFFDS